MLTTAQGTHLRSVKVRTTRQLEPAGAATSSGQPAVSAAVSAAAAAAAHSCTHNCDVDALHHGLHCAALIALGACLSLCCATAGPAPAAVITLYICRATHKGDVDALHHVLDYARLLTLLLPQLLLLCLLHVIFID
jgi:hypothetical protein